MCGEAFTREFESISDCGPLCHEFVRSFEPKFRGNIIFVFDTMFILN